MGAEADAKALLPGVLSVLLPVYNERDTIEQVLETVCGVPVEKEVLIVDDASTDGTTDYLRRYVEGKLPGVSVYYHERNQGKGAALRTIIPHARGEFCIVQDADLEYDPSDYAAVLRAFHDHGAYVVYGSRFREARPHMRLANLVANRLFAFMVRVLYRSPITDEATCYKAFRTQLLQSVPLTCRRFEFCPEVTAKVLKRGHAIVEIPIHYEARTLAQGKKIRWTDGIAAIWTLIKFRFVD